MNLVTLSIFQILALLLGAVALIRSYLNYKGYQKEEFDGHQDIMLRNGKFFPLKS
jgi:hypothetical protein